MIRMLTQANHGQRVPQTLRAQLRYQPLVVVRPSRFLNRRQWL